MQQPMRQIPYTLKYALGKPNKNGLCVVYLKYHSIVSRIELSSKIRVDKRQFSALKQNAPIIKHPNAELYNKILNEFKIDIDYRIASGDKITKQYLLGNSNSNESVTDFIDSFCDKMKGRLSDGRISRYKVIKTRILEFDPGVQFNEIDLDWLQRFEVFLRPGRAGNTINTLMKTIVAVLNRAVDAEKIDKKSFAKYRPPAYTDEIPVYLTEDQINDFYKVVVSCGNEQIKRAGYYFLLSCYAGYRIGDLMSFKYSERVIGNAIVLRANKNGKIVSIPIFKKLGEILEYCKFHPLSISEQEMREWVKQIAKIAGIKFDIKVHSARHSFAMLMLDKGLTLDEVAELLGDSKDVAKRYARITNKHLHKRVMEVMKH